jgi:hypothetical protein
MNDELERFRKGSDYGLIEALSWNSTGGTKESHEIVRMASGSDEI